MTANAQPSVHYVDLPKPPEGEMTAVVPGVSWIRFPLPFRLDHVNIWVLDDGDDVTVIDAGLGDAETRARWETILAGPLSGRRITRVVATHYHPDHMGLCGWLVERTGAEFVAGLAEWLYARVMAKPSAPASVEATRSFYQRAGASAALIDHLLERGGAYRSLVGPIPPTLRRLRVGETLTIGGRDWRMVNISGHSPEPVALYCQALNLLISGDQVLPRISPNISVWPGEPDGDPLADFLGSFPVLYALPADVMVLPSHDRPFVGLHDRLNDLQAHHRDRIEELAGLCREPQTAQQLAEQTFAGGLDLHQQMFALGEVMAHLNHLMRLRRVDRRLDADGLWRYRTV